METLKHENSMQQCVPKLMGIKVGESISQGYLRYNVCGFDVLMRKSMLCKYERTITSDNALDCSIVFALF